MVIVVFSVICIAAVLFLLRFLVAIESETQSARRRQTELVKLSVYRPQPFRQAGDPGPGLMLVHSRTSRQDSTLRPLFIDQSISRERNSQYRGA
jgi:hypothetical protein